MFRWLYLFPHRSLLSIPAVIAWLESMTRLESRFLVTRTRLESRWEKLSLDSSHVFHKMTRLESRFSQNDSTRVTFFTKWLDSNHSQWLETRVRVIFCKTSEFLIYKPSSFAHKEMSICCFSDDQDWRKQSRVKGCCPPQKKIQMQNNPLISASIWADACFLEPVAN